MTVYFFRRRDTGRIKIGYVQVEADQDPTDALARRMALVARQLKAPLELLAQAPGKRRVELWFQKRHAGVALGGEWFEPTKRLLADIDMLVAGRRIAGQPLPPEPPAPPSHRSRYRCWIVWPRANGGGASLDVRAA